jgi:DNA repair photolyase
VDIIYEPKGKALEYAPLAVDLYQGCSHGCGYCYVPRSKKCSSDTFFKTVQPIPDILCQLAKDAAKLAAEGDDREILLCFHTDPYQMAAGDHVSVTREAIEILVSYGLRFTVLTKAGLAAVVDFDLLQAWHKSAFGSTLIFFNQDDADQWEPRAGTIASRTGALAAAHERGIRTWVSMEPVIDPVQAFDLIRGCHRFVDHWKIGKINDHPEMEKRVDWISFRRDIKELLDSLGADYYLKKSLTEL